MKTIINTVIDHQVVVMFSCKIEKEQSTALMEALANPTSSLKVAASHQQSSCPDCHQFQLNAGAQHRRQLALGGEI